ncbi:ribose-phosphate pyrophosphokinase-like domain-containing protein, partial [Acinetobacter oleivorans]|uniref:ribose-phosphate pyrophosphokinase-like domain-containing protein n=1 Tax=Acinetobacter oleivorans TaxID=1148157 RepID=UPI00148EFB3B
MANSSLIEFGAHTQHHVNLHIPLGAASVGHFSDGEISVEITENVRGKDVFIVQPTCAPT